MLSLSVICIGLLMVTTAALPLSKEALSVVMVDAACVSPNAKACSGACYEGDEHWMLGCLAGTEAPHVTSPVTKRVMPSPKILHGTTCAALGFTNVYTKPDLAYGPHDDLSFHTTEDLAGLALVEIFVKDADIMSFATGESWRKANPTCSSARGSSQQKA
eukprot:gnl/TRDRNA2_/TRDRNA2_176828_c12_seq1.p1 gnl/TRDRNA2_/TRDRNA2_176828_c12~~gnl/TRDRNA2_/TRDRNA2_176828_c12_seq1.p1  ORF type:complete len:160 (-),score=25.68 gnl/TRDRNA2_/TRDRNA2_176828_c12_seq1:362-841(-)